MESPERHLLTSSLESQESPLFTFLNSLSPIKPAKPEHASHGFSELKFPPPPSIFVTPKILAKSSLQGSNFKRKQACLESGQNCNQADNNSRENPFSSMKDQNLLSRNNSSEHVESQVVDCTPISSLGSEVTSHSTDGLCKLLNSVENKDERCTLEHSVDAFQGSHLKQLLTAAHLISDSKLSNKEVFEPSQYATDVGQLMSEIVPPLNVNLEGWQSGALSSLSDLSIQFTTGSLLSVDTSGHRAVKNRHFDSLPTGCPSDHGDDKSMNDARDPESEAANKVSLSIQRGFRRRCLDFRISDGQGINNIPSSISSITSPGLPSPNLCLKTSRQCTLAMSDAARNIDSNEVLPCHLLRESTCAALELDCQPYATCPPAGTFSSSCNLPSGIGLHLNSLTGGMAKLQSARGERKNAGYLTCVKLASDVVGATPPSRQSAYQPVEVLSSPSSTGLQTNLQLVECFEEFGNSSQGDTNMEEQLVISFVEELERDLCRDQSVAHVDLSAARNRQLGDFEPCGGQVETCSCELKTVSLSTVPWQMDVDVEQECTFRSGMKARKRASSGDNYENGCKRCNCKKSKCLKLYCECFAAGLFCVDNCSCQECHNKPTFEETVLEIRQQIESRNPLAFAPRVVQAVAQSPITGEKTSESTPSARHKKGCSCKKSKCLKKYCECYQAGVGCSDSCRCEGCQNMYGKKEGSEGFEGKVVRTEFNKKDAAEDSTVSMEFGSKLSHRSRFQHDDLSPITPSFRFAGQIGSLTMQRATRRRCSSNEQMQSPNSLLTELKLQNNCKAQNSSLVPKTGSRHLPSSVICTHEAMKSVQLSAHWDGLGDFCTLTPLPQAPQHKIMLSTSLSSGTDSSPSINFQQSNDTCCSKRDSVSTIELVQCGSSMPCQQSVRSSIVTGCAQPLKNFQCNPTTSSGNASSSGIGLDTPCKDFLFSDTNTSVFLEDDTLFDILKEPEPTWSPSLLPLKSNSPKQKRVSPPHFVGLRAISQKSPSVRSCRKFTLQAISSTVAATKSAI